VCDVLRARVCVRACDVLRVCVCDVLRAHVCVRVCACACACVCVCAHMCVCVCVGSEAVLSTSKPLPNDAAHANATGNAAQCALRHNAQCAVRGTCSGCARRAGSRRHDQSPGRGAPRLRSGLLWRWLAASNGASECVCVGGGGLGVGLGVGLRVGVGGGGGG
jgi:hypothetical protein